MNFNIITIFPNIFDSYFNESIIKRAQNKKIIKIKTRDLRQWTKDKHKTVDDKPYGGGAGMVLMAEPIIKAVTALQKSKIPNSKIILLSAKGKKWNQAMAKRYSKLDNLILICGRYEGVDERVKKLIDEEISIGDYVLTGGEIPAMVIIDSVTRLLPGVLGNEESAVNESHSNLGVLEHPHYTRPEVLKINCKNYKVPKVLLSGNHAEIEKWRNKQSRKI
jgi:tRNA (guanine37-N1)-methyltransferase